MNKTRIAKKLPEILLYTSIVLWCLSLFFTAVVYDGKIMPGMSIIFLGVLFGWLGLYVQAYTNIIYLLIVGNGFFNRPFPKLSIVIFIIGMSSFFLTRLQILTERDSIYANIESWGWGAIFWISAYALMVLHSFHLIKPKRIKTVISLALMIPVVWVIIYVIGAVQYKNANVEEKSRVFKAFSKKEIDEAFKKNSSSFISDKYFLMRPAIARPLSGLPYIPLDKLLLNENNIVAFKGDLTNRFDYNAELDGLKIRLPDRYLYRGEFVSDYYKFIISADATLKPDYTISTYKTGELNGIQIFDEKAQKFVWQAPIKKTKRKYGYSSYPNYAFSKFFSALDNHSLRIETNESFELDKATITEEPSVEEDFSHYKIELLNGDKLWIDLESGHNPFSEMNVFANADYLLLTGKSGDNGTMKLINRKTHAATLKISLKSDNPVLFQETSVLQIEKLSENKFKRQNFRISFDGRKPIEAEEER